MKEKPFEEKLEYKIKEFLGTSVFLNYNAEQKIKALKDWILDSIPEAGCEKYNQAINDFKDNLIKSFM